MSLNEHTSKQVTLFKVLDSCRNISWGQIKNISKNPQSWGFGSISLPGLTTQQLDNWMDFTVLHIYVP